MISTKDDLNELKQDILDPYTIHSSKVWLMPAADDRETLRKASPKIIKYCLDKGYSFSNRLHIEIWDKKTGV